MVLMVAARTRVWLAVLGFILLTLIAVVSIRSASHLVLIVATQTGPVCFKVEVADNWFTRGKGLMFRDTLQDHQGMLFRYDGETPVTFWMKHVRMSLDMIFISKDGRIAHIHERATPEDPTPITSPMPVTSVLEIPGGASKRAQITPGDNVQLLENVESATTLCQLHQSVR